MNYLVKFAVIFTTLAVPSLMLCKILEDDDTIKNLNRENAVLKMKLKAEEDYYNNVVSGTYPDEECYSQYVADLAFASILENEM